MVVTLTKVIYKFGYKQMNISYTNILKCIFKSQNVWWHESQAKLNNIILTQSGNIPLWNLQVFMVWDYMNIWYMNATIKASVTTARTKFEVVPCMHFSGSYYLANMPTAIQPPLIAGPSTRTTFVISGNMNYEKRCAHGCQQLSVEGGRGGEGTI